MNNVKNPTTMNSRLEGVDKKLVPDELVMRQRANTDDGAFHGSRVAPPPRRGGRGVGGGREEIESRRRCRRGGGRGDVAFRGGGA